MRSAVASVSMQPDILAVGDRSEWLSRGCALPSEASIRFVEYSALDASMLDQMEPSVVISPLLTSGFDCIDLAEKLEQAGFSGQYRAMSQRRIPRPDLVIQEIRQLCPTLDFDLICEC